MGLFGGAKTIVGLDIGSSSIKAVELRKAHGEIEVAHIGVEPLASDIVVDSMIVDSGSVSSAITKIFTENAIVITLDAAAKRQAKKCLEKNGKITFSVRQHSVTKLPQILDNGKEID